MPDLSSRLLSLASMSLRVSAVITPAWSTTLPLSAGKSKASASDDRQRRKVNATAAALATRPSLREAIRRSDPAITYVRVACPSRLSASKFHCRRLFRTFAGRKLSHRLVARKGGLRPDDGWERPQRRIIGAHGFDIVASCYRDPILGAFKL